MKILMVDHKAEKIASIVTALFKELHKRPPQFITCSTMHEVTPDLLEGVTVALIDRYVIEAGELPLLEMLRTHGVERIIGMGRTNEDRQRFQAAGVTEYGDKSAGFEQLVFRIRNPNQELST